MINESIRQAQAEKSFLIYLSVKRITLFLGMLLFTTSLFAQKTYKKTYYNNGVLKEEGWTKTDKKTDYWKFYYQNGNIEKEGHFSKDKPIKYWYFYTDFGSKKSEGHFINGEKTNWWLFYDDMGKIHFKCEFKHDQKDGYCLIYKNEKLISAEKFKAGKKTKEWTNLKAFKKENNLLNLQ